MSARSLPDGMSAETWERYRRLPESRYATAIERAAILHFDAGLDWPEADERAIAAESPVQRNLF